MVRPSNRRILISVAFIAQLLSQCHPAHCSMDGSPRDGAVQLRNQQQHADHEHSQLEPINSNGDGDGNNNSNSSAEATFLTLPALSLVGTDQRNDDDTLLSEADSASTEQRNDADDTIEDGNDLSTYLYHKRYVKSGSSSPRMRQSSQSKSRGRRRKQKQPPRSRRKEGTQNGNLSGTDGDQPPGTTAGTDSYDPGDAPDFDCHKYAEYLDIVCEDEAPPSDNLGSTDDPPTVSPTMDATRTDETQGPIVGVETPPPLPANNMAVDLSIALTHDIVPMGADQVEYFRSVIEKVTTRLLDEETQFEVLSKGANAQGQQNGTTRSLSVRRSGHKSYRQRHSQGRRDLGTSRESEDDRKLSRLKHSSTIINAIASIDGLQLRDGDVVASTFHWYSVQVYYDTFWMSGQSMKKEDLVEQIRYTCQAVIDYNVMSGKYTKKLRHVIDLDHRADESAFSVSDTEMVDIMASASAGNEARTVDDISKEATRRASTSSDSSDTSSSGDSGTTSSYDFSDEVGYQELRLDPYAPWSAREWLGLVLLVVTASFGVGLPLVASFLRSREERERTWAQNAYLTEEGLKEVLDVGWRYKYEDPEQHIAKHGGGDVNGHVDADVDVNGAAVGAGANASVDPQFFLQIFEKGKVGYNEDNSVLRGGPHVVHAAVGVSQNDPTVPTASTSSSRMTPQHRN